MNENALTVSSVFRDAMAIFKKSFWKIVGTLLIGLVLYLPFLALNYFSEGKSKIIVAAASLVTSLCLIVLQSVVQQATLRVAIKEVSVGQAFSSSLSDWRAVVTTFILMTAIIYGGFIFLIIPGIIFSLLFSFASAVLADEGKSGIEALMRSKSYVAGRWWKTLGYFILSGLAVIGAILVAAIGFIVSPVIGIILMIPAVVFAFTFPVAFLVALYRALAASRLEVRSAAVPAPHWFQKAAIIAGIIIFVFMLFAGAFSENKKNKAVPARDFLGSYLGM